MLEYSFLCVGPSYLLLGSIFSKPGAYICSGHSSLARGPQYTLAHLSERWAVVLIVGRARTIVSLQDCSVECVGSLLVNWGRIVIVGRSVD